MADILLQCPGCGKQVTVSEFVDRSVLTCRSCGATFQEEQPDDQESSPTSEVADENASDIDTDARAGIEPTQSTIPNTVIAKVRQNRNTGFRWTHALRAWMLLGALSMLALYIRFGGWLNEDHILWIEAYGPIILLALHVYVVLKAFRDSVVQGVLCLLIPFYSIYYVMILSYDYIARAIIGAAMMGLGWDSLHVIIKEAEAILPAINDWLNSGI